MSRGFLTIIAITQGFVLLLLFLFLFWNRVSQWFWIWLRERRADRLAESLRSWFSGECTDSELLTFLNACPLRAARQEMEKSREGKPARKWDELLNLVRSSRWFSRLKRTVRSPFWWRRMDAAEALGLVGLSEDVELLQQLLDDSHPGVEMAALAAARELTLTELLEPLLMKAVSIGLTREYYVLHILLDYGSRLVPVLKKRFKSPDNEKELVTLLKVAGRLAAPELADVVLEQLNSPHLEVRIVTVRALSSFKGTGIESALRHTLLDESWQVRAQAATGLGILAVKGAEKELRDALSDRNWWVRLRSALALRRYGKKGIGILADVKAADDAYAYDMAQYVLRLDDAAMAEY